MDRFIIVRFLSDTCALARQLPGATDYVTSELVRVDVTRPAMVYYDDDADTPGYGLRIPTEEIKRRRPVVDELIVGVIARDLSNIIARGKDKLLFLRNWVYGDQEYAIRQAVAAGEYICPEY